MRKMYSGYKVHGVSSYKIEKRKCTGSVASKDFDYVDIIIYDKEGKRIGEVTLFLNEL